MLPNLASLHAGGGGIQLATAVQVGNNTQHLLAQAQQAARMQGMQPAQGMQPMQIINAYNADGQPVAIAVNANGTHTILHGQATMAAQRQLPSTQQLHLQQVAGLPAGFRQATTLVAPNGQRLIQLPNGELQALNMQQAPAGIKLVQQGMGLVQQQQQQQRILVQAAPAGGNGNGNGLPNGLTLAQQPMALQQRLVPAAVNTTTNGMVSLKPGVQTVTIQQQNGGHAQNVAPVNVGGGLQMGRSLIHMGAGRPNTVTTYNPTTGLRTSNGAAAPSGNGTAVLATTGNGTQVQLVQQGMPVQLQNTVLVQQTNGTMLADTGTAARMAALQQPGMQQQVKDTVAQQRQQQLLASLRAQLNAGGGVVTAPAGNGGAQLVLKTVQTANGGQQIVGISGGNGMDVAAAQQQIKVLQSLMAAQQQAQAAASQNQGGNTVMINTGGQGKDGAVLLSSLTPAQQQKVLLSMQGAANQGQGTLVFNGGRMGSESERAASPAVMYDLNALEQAMQQQRNKNAAATAQPVPGSRSSSSDNAAAMLAQLSAENNNEQRVHTSKRSNSSTTTSPAFALNLPGGGKENLSSILYSIGVELARHGFTVAQAIEANWLGVLSPTDVAVLQEAYAAEEQRLLAGTRAQLAANKEASSPALSVHSDMPHLLSVNGGGLSLLARSHGSPAGSVTSAAAFSSAAARRASVGSAAFGEDDAHHRSLLAGAGSSALPTPSATAAPPPLAEIDDACFSAFAYDFFGEADRAADDNGLLRALESEAGSAVSGGADSLLHGKGSVCSEAVHTEGSRMGEVPLRTPSWPPSDGNTKAGPSSVASFSDVMCAVTGAGVGSDRAGPALQTSKPAMKDMAVANGGSGQELVARFANLDLGCGFY